jgi:hypothetical protein
MLTKNFVVGAWVGKRRRRRKTSVGANCGSSILFDVFDKLPPDWFEKPL